jgi:hypothetical protein
VVLPADQSEETAATPIQLTPEKENVVASEILGEWLLDEQLSSRLGGSSDHAGKGPISFRADQAAEKRMVRFLIELTEKLSTENPKGMTPEVRAALRKVYLAGVVEFGGRKQDFALISIYGNPHIFFSDRQGDAESENVMLARDLKGDNDLLFLGGDFNNQSFGAYKRRIPQ